MSLRPPQNLTSHHNQGSVPSALDYEIMGEMAASLGRAGEKVEQTLAQLAAAAMPEQEMRLKAAARAVHAYFIQRELCGLRNHEAAISDYNIPRAVLIRLGAS